jgi:hypothetical protein
VKRSGLPEGSVGAAVDIDSTTTEQNFHVTLGGSVANPPSISLTSHAGVLACSGAATSCGAQTSGLSTAITDDAGVAGAYANWVDGGTTHTAKLTQDGTAWYGSYGPFSTIVPCTLKITAADAPGNQAKLPFTVGVARCT